MGCQVEIIWLVCPVEMINRKTKEIEIGYYIPYVVSGIMVLTRTPPPDPPPRGPYILRVNARTQKRQKLLISNFIDTFHTLSKMNIAGFPIWRPSRILCELFNCQKGTKRFELSRLVPIGRKTSHNIQDGRNVGNPAIFIFDMWSSYSVI